MSEHFIHRMQKQEIYEQNKHLFDDLSKMEILEVRRLIKQHVYYQSCSYEYAWNNYIHADIKKQYSFEEVMKQTF